MDLKKSEKYYYKKTDDDSIDDDMKCDDNIIVEEFISHTLDSFRGREIATVNPCPHKNWKSCTDAYNILTSIYDPIKTKQTICFLPRMCNCCT